MYAIATPFQFNVNGGVKTTTNINTVIEQQIINILSTSMGERVMRPQFGGNFKNLLFEPADELVFSEYSMDAIQILNENLEVGKALDVRVDVPSTDFSGDPVSSVVYVSVRYAAPPDTVSVVTFVVGNEDYIITGGVF